MGKNARFFSMGSEPSMGAESASAISQPGANKGMANRGMGLFSKSVELINRYNAVARQRRDYGTGVPLSVSESHLIEAVGKGGPITSVEIARAMGVTKGAVSQMLPRLVRCGMVERTPSPTDGRASLVELTPLGRQAFEAHAAVHEGLAAAFDRVEGTMAERSKADAAALIDSVSAYLAALLDSEEDGKDGRES